MVKVPLEKQQEEMAQKVDLSDGLGKVNEVLFKRRERVVEAYSRAPKVQLQSRDIPILIDEVVQFEANKRIRGTAESVSQYYGTEDREQAMREDKVRALVNGDKILERISEIPADCTNPDVIKQLVNNAFVVQLIKGKGQEEAVPRAKGMFLETYQQLCSSIEVAGVESADFRAVAQELERNKQLLLKKAPELTRMFENQEAGRAFDAGAHKDFFELIKEYETIFKKSKADIETRDRVDDEGLIAGYEGSDRRVKDYQSKIQAIGKCDLAISMLTREEADVVERVSVSLQSTEETKALYGELKDSAFLYQGRSPETKQKPRFASFAAKDQRYNADVKRYNEAKTRICDLFGVEPKHENLQAIIKIANAKESSVVVEDEIGAIKAQLIEKKLRIAPTTEERKAVLRIVQAEVPIIAEAGTPIPPPRTVSSRDSIIGSVKARPRSESNGSTSPLATPFTLSGNPGGLMAGKK